MKIMSMVLALALLVGAAQAQESEILPCAPWRGFDATQESTTRLGEADRRQLVDEALGRVQRFHIDPEFDGVDLDELRQAYAPRIMSAEFDHEVFALLEEMLAWVDASFTSADVVERQRTLASYTGVGFFLSILSDGHVLGIDYVFPGSPAEAAGLARGDRIIGVDQRTACPHPFDILGPAGTDVTLTVTSPGQAPRRITITRARVEPIARPRALQLDEPGIGYLWPGDFAMPGHPAAIRTALDGIGAFDATDPLDGLILDLRGAIGWDQQALDAIRSLAGLFTDGILVHLVEGSTRTAIFATAQPERLDDVALVILVDADTDGFHGMLAAALQERRHAQVVGEPVRSGWRLYQYESLPDGSEVGVPVGEIELLDGNRPRQSGLLPNSVMTVDWRDYPEQEDPYVAEAIRLIQTAGIGTD